MSVRATLSIEFLTIVKEINCYPYNIVRIQLNTSLEKGMVYKYRNKLVT